VIALVLCVVLLVGAAVGLTIYRLNEIGRVNVPNLTQVKGGVEDILLVGSTSRCAVKPAKSFEVYVHECESGVNGVNSDVIMIIRLNSNDHRASLLSIPRDTFVPDARINGTQHWSNKVDSALADGPGQLVQAIEEDFGIPINHYVVLNFESFADIVNALGGVNMYFPTQVMDMDGLRQMRTGCQHIGGIEALALVRARHVYYSYDRKTGTWRGYDGSGDLGRIVRDHLFLRVLASTVKQHGLGNPVTDEQLLGAVAPFLTVDTTLGIGEMRSLLSTFSSLGVNSVPLYTAPIIVDTQPYMYKGLPYGDVVFPSEPQDQQTINAFLGEDPAGLKLHANAITVSVVDGTGSPATTARVASKLRALGYRVVATGSQTPVGPISETTIEYPSAAHLVQAEKVISALSGTVVMARAATLGHADVTVVTGSDLAVASAHPARSSNQAKSGPTKSGPTTPSTITTTTTTTVTATTATTATTPNSDGGALTAPTAATSAIPHYDPRACPTNTK
jgi:LCP family protein required for cell wall assembly